MRAGERFARFKPNGRILFRAPLSALIVTGVTGRRFTSRKLSHGAAPRIGSSSGFSRDQHTEKVVQLTFRALCQVFGLSWSIARPIRPRFA